MFTATLEDKKLLAKFEGYLLVKNTSPDNSEEYHYKLIQPLGGICYERFYFPSKESENKMWISGLLKVNYDSNWLYLMRIIDKIEEQKGVSLYISKYECVLQYEDAHVVNAKFKCDDESFTKIQQAYTVCVEYIKSLQK